MPALPLRIGTRTSELAMTQAAAVRMRLIEAFPGWAEPGALEIVPISTAGDRERHRPLYDIGGKGLFIKDLEEALQQGAIDLAVHSLKDVPGVIPEDCIIAAVLEREDARDALIVSPALIAAGGTASFDALPAGIVIGTCSPRRMAQIRLLRHDVTLAPMRGNVTTRLRKVQEGEVGATILAMAGLNRLGLTGRFDAAAVGIERMLPAVGQGTIAIECRTADIKLREALKRINHTATWRATQAERALLAAVDGSCRTAVAGHATLDGDTLRLRAFLAAPEGIAHLARECRGHWRDGAAMGREIGEALRCEGAAFLQ